MRIQIDLASASSTAALAGANEFSSFDVEVKIPDHMWIEPERIIDLAGALGDDPDWRANFDAMVSYASKHGWVDDAGRIRAHVVRQEGA